MRLSTRTKVILFLIWTFVLIFGFEFWGYYIFDPIFKNPTGEIIGYYLFIFIFSSTGFIGLVGLIKREFYSKPPFMVLGPVYRYKRWSAVVLGTLFTVGGFFLTYVLVSILFKDVLLKSEYNFHLMVLIVFLSLSFSVVVLTQKRLKEKMKGKKSL